MPGGQLVWCNAHFVRREMYSARSRPGWVSRLRDACITQATGFYDLSVLSLKCLLEEPCPDSLRVEVAGILESPPTTGDNGEGRGIRHVVRVLIR